MTLSEAFSLGALLVDLGIVFALIPRVLVQRRESAATLSWVIFIVLVPLVGALLYFVLGTRSLRRRRMRRARYRELLGLGGSSLRSMLATFSPENDEQARLARHFGVNTAQATVGNEVEVFHDGEEAFKALCSAIEEARRYVHLEYYIFNHDETGKKLLALLERRAREGVEVRLLIDSLGSFSFPESAAEPLRQAGGRFSRFLPITILSRPFSVNLRNHRKIVVIDGKIAFTGGMNIGDEYRSRNPDIGHWRDTHARVRGPAALRLLEVFAEDWHFSTAERCTSETYLSDPELPGHVTVEVVESGPDQTAEVIYRRLFVAITRAERRVWLTTPYFIPDRAILVALTTAAQRGVDVRLLLPGFSDHPLVLLAGRAHYAELLEAGVHILEYDPGMLHAKTMVVDDEWVTIGSANMDRRSFALNWEANLILLDRGLTAAMARRFELDSVHARPILFPYRPPTARRFGEAIAILLAPLL